MARSLFSRILFVCVALPVFVLVSTFCVMNAHMVTFTWWPFAHPLDLPLFVFILTSFAAGFLVGGALTWLDER